MVLIRDFEDACAEHYARGNIRGFVHLYSGQEATGVGVISALVEQDYVVTHYRDHGHALARGLDPNRIMAELFGRRTGLSKGKGGSMHLFDTSKGFMGGHAIVGGQLPIAVGMALAQQYRGEGGVTVVFCGDGAANQGTYHESLNLAGVWNLPLLFVMENNGFGMGSAIELVRAGGENFSAAVATYGIEATVVNGMDLIEVAQATETAVAKLRNGGGPLFLEAKTYRFEGHSVADGQKYRSAEEIKQWKSKRDPISAFKKVLNASGITDDEIDRVHKEVDKVIKQCIEFSLASSHPHLAELWDDIIA